MNLQFFFKHEGRASSLLATLLDQRQDFRDAFFDLLEPEPPLGVDTHGLTPVVLSGALIELLKSTQWNIDVESRGVDIRLEAEDGSAVIILENKVRAASVQRGQLEKYYAAEVRRQHNKNCQVGVVFITPGSEIGKRELAGLRTAMAKRRGSDFVAGISWTDLDTIVRELHSRPEDQDFIHAGFEHVMKTIENAKKVKWPLSAEREIVFNIASQVRELLLQQGAIDRVGNPWPSKDGYVLSTQKGGITMWLSFRFTPKAEKPYDPKGWRVSGGFKLRVVCMLKLSGISRRDPELKEKWKRMVSDSQVKLSVAEVPMTLREDGWLTADQEVSDTQEKIVARAGEIGLEALRLMA